MTVRSMSDRKMKRRLRNAAGCHEPISDRAVLPEKFSYPKKPVTLAVPVIFSRCHCTIEELLGDAIRQYVELTGIVPFDWEPMPVPPCFQSQMKPGDKFYVVWFGFDTLDEAHAVKAKFSAMRRHVEITTEAEERESIRRYLELVEEQGGERPTYDAEDGLGEMYWRDHPYFKAA
jgi:hypothetical protein